MKTCQIALNLLLEDCGHPVTSRSLRPVLVGQQGPLKLQDFHMISVLDSVKKMRGTSKGQWAKLTIHPAQCVKTDCSYRIGRVNVRHGKLTSHMLLCGIEQLL